MNDEGRTNRGPWVTLFASACAFVGCSPVADGDYREALECSIWMGAASEAFKASGHGEFAAASLVEGFEQKTVAEGTKLGKSIREINDDRKDELRKLVKESRAAKTEADMRASIEKLFAKTRECIDAY